MLIVLSPAKKLDWDVPHDEVRQPAFQEEANILAGHARELSVDDLKALMGLSDDLARLNRDRFHAMDEASDADNSRPAALVFAGDTYQGLEARTMEPHAIAFAEDRLRILSGLYGLLGPLDSIQAYRLEMGSRLRSGRGGNLYAFWGDRIARALDAQAAAIGTDTLVNCASQEYFGAVDRKALGLRVITPRFLEDGPKGPRVVSFHAKRARGAMARFVCENRLTDPDAITGFDAGGYVHMPELSDGPDQPAFLRRAA
ncbi:peroxide stress protein YaaA [Palleronia sp. LCG004]|uniref:peroxide stress protein YaaA n=1 Tax=Palleronia sp. LCG004 TaxID=3079304 RepID=UPI0029428093|nr:peroxide stress protein YaaA [Palleronia sp. LCG004]WOI56138.1 peroxide stress protein YaaA [Palleronia sp. LCG004]